jgi:hypothetical protein
MTKPIHYPDAEMIEKFNRVGYVVEATNTERFFIWQQHMSHENGALIKKWQQDYCGYCPTIGWIDDRPICACVNFATLDGMLVAFVELTSQLADYKMLDEWVAKYIPVARYDDVLGRCGKSTNAMNFGHVINEIRYQREKK